MRVAGELAVRGNRVNAIIRHGHDTGDRKPGEDSH